MCRNVRAEIVPKLCTQKCAENVHTQNVQNCAHADLCRKCAHRVLCRSCAQSLCPSCAQSCVRELCRRKVSGDAQQKFFLCVNILCHVCKSFRWWFAQIVRKCTCPELCAECPLCKCPKMTKNDQKWPKLTIWPKCPKMAQNGPKWQKMSRVGTWLVTGPLRLVTQGGKSCQNMH